MNAHLVLLTAMGTLFAQILLEVSYVNAMMATLEMEWFAAVRYQYCYLWNV